MKRDKLAIIDNFREQYYFLKKSCIEYDKGDITEIKRISVSLRNLLKDKNRDVSALKLLEKKDSISYWDSSTKSGGMSNFIIKGMRNCTVIYMPIYMGLVIKEINGINDVNKYTFKPLFYKNEWQQNDKLDFENWYNQVIYDDPSGFILTREKLILSIAEQDGGNHFDIKINNQYYQFKQNDSLKLIVNGQIVLFENNPAYTSLRQIAHELTESINNSILKEYIEDMM
ncbi:MAG: hypothetical protein WBH98_08185 [Bacteroidales bacterium]